MRGAPKVDVDIDAPAEATKHHGAAVVVAALFLLLDGLGMQPVEDRARSDIGWGYRTDGGIFGGMFGGDGGGGSAGGGGGDGGGGGGF